MCRCSAQTFKLAWQPLPAAHRVPHWLVSYFQIPEEEGAPPGLGSSGGTTPDVGNAQLADVAALWQECRRGRSTRRRARTSVTSMYSSGAPPTMTPQLLLCQSCTSQSEGRKGQLCRLHTPLVRQCSPIAGICCATTCSVTFVASTDRTTLVSRCSISGSMIGRHVHPLLSPCLTHHLACGRIAQRFCATDMLQPDSVCMRAGAMEALLEDIKGQRAAADLQLAAARCFCGSLKQH